MSFGGRGRCSILPTDAKVIACYHDFKVVSLTPSVTLRVENRHDESKTPLPTIEVSQICSFILHI